jgi:hypothetical protein
MLYREIMAVCSEIHTKHINTAVLKVKEIIVKPDGTYPYHYTLHNLLLHTNKLTLSLQCTAVSSPNKDLVFFSGKTSSLFGSL